MSDVAIEAAAARPATDRRAQSFLLAMLIVSILPPVAMAWFPGPKVEPDTIAFKALVLVLMFGASHVALTGFFLLDRRYRSHLNQRSAYSYLLPAFIVAAAVATVWLGGEDGATGFGLLALAWNIHHFGRQNWGVLALAAAGTGSPPPRPLERRIAWSAPFPTIAVLLASAPLGARAEWAASVSAFAYAAAIGIASVAAFEGLRRGVAGDHPLRAAMAALPGLFFLPVFLIDPIGIPAVGVAHALQYAVIMGYLAASREGVDVRSWLMPLVLLSVSYVCVYMLVIASTIDAPPPTMQIATTVLAGINIWHFLLDADLWRLRQPFQRRAIRESLPFLFR